MRLIVTADWHLREDKPRCRIDEDWLETQRKAVQFVYSTAKDREADVAIVGDIFGLERSIVHPSIVNMFLDIALKSDANTYVLAGNHDLPYHNWEYVGASSYGLLASMCSMPMSKIKSLSEIGMAANFRCSIEGACEKFVFVHELVFRDIIPYRAKGRTAQELLDEFKNADYVFIGDNHRHFVFKSNDRIVINPGCLIRQASDFKEYQSVIVFVDTNKEELEIITVPDNEALVDDAYIQNEKERDDHFGALVRRLETGDNISFSFIDELRKEMNESKELLGGAFYFIQGLIEEVK